MPSRLCCVLNARKQNFGPDYTEPICHECKDKICDDCKEEFRGCLKNPTPYNTGAHHCKDCSYVCGPNLGKEKLDYVPSTH